MSLRIDVRIHPDRDPSSFSQLRGAFEQNLQLRRTLHVEQQDPAAQRQHNLVTSLADAGKYDLFCRPRRSPEHALQFAAGDDIEAATELRKQTQQAQVGICLHRITKRVRKARKCRIQCSRSFPQRFTGIHVERSSVGLRQGTKVLCVAVQYFPPIVEPRVTKDLLSGRTRHFFLALSFTLRTTTVSSSKASPGEE